MIWWKIIVSLGRKTGLLSVVLVVLWVCLLPVSLQRREEMMVMITKWRGSASLSIKWWTVCCCSPGMCMFDVSATEFCYLPFVVDYMCLKWLFACVSALSLWALLASGLGGTVLTRSNSLATGRFVRPRQGAFKLDRQKLHVEVAQPLSRLLSGQTSTNAWVTLSESYFVTTRCG